MAKERDKWIFIIIMVILLVVLFFRPAIDENMQTGTDNNTYGIESTKTSEVETGYMLENDTLGLKYDDIGGSLFIEGSGILYASDLSALLTKNNIQISDIENIVIGDNITEIGSNVINGYEYLYALKIGSSVKKIHNGAIRNCSNLKYLFMPSNVKKIAMDFLYGCEKCFVISDGRISEMISDSKVENALVIEKIETYEDLKEYLESGKLVLMNFTSDQLASNDPDSGTSTMLLHSNYCQYGPYCDLPKGNYIIKVIGDGFSGISKEGVYTNIKDCTGEAVISDMDIENKEIRYNISLTENAQGIEFCLLNDTKKNIRINEIQIGEKIDIPIAVQKWWELG